MYTNSHSQTTLGEDGGQTRIRYHFLDNLRAIAMLAGVVFHAALSYSLLIHEGWPTADTDSSRIIDFFCWLSHTFRMPLFFLISGFFACLLIDKRGELGFIKNRAKRIVLPFVVFLPLVTISIFVLIGYIAQHTEVDTLLINFVRNAMQNPDQANQEPPPLSTMHLWFLYYLIYFCGIAALCSKYLNLSNKLLDRLAHPITLLLALPALTSVGLLQVHMPHPGAESFTPQLWAVTFYGGFYFFGWVMFRRKNMIERLTPYTKLMIATSIVSYALFFYLLPSSLDAETFLSAGQTLATIDLTQSAFAVTTAILAWHMTFLCLIAAKKYLDWKNAALRFTTDASYWIYIIHIPIVFLLQASFHLIHWPIAIELFLIIAITLSIGFLSYALMVRHTPIGWMLNGKQNSKSKENINASSNTATQFS